MNLYNLIIAFAILMFSSTYDDEVFLCNDIHSKHPLKIQIIFTISTLRLIILIERINILFVGTMVYPGTRHAPKIHNIAFSCI